jgi:hypothetical protein
MKKGLVFTVFSICLLVSSLMPTQTIADVEPLIGATLFGGAERGTAGKEVKQTPTCTTGNTTSCNTDRVLADPVGLGGFELFGVLPFSPRFGLQSSFGFTGQNDGYRLGFSAGPLYDYGSGKFGLFVDYEYRKEPLGELRPALAARGDINDVGNRYQNFIFLRGVWTHYFENFDLVVSYTQPVNHVQDSSDTNWDPRRNPACFPKKAYAINELKSVVRTYPTSQIEADVGMLVNSFAGVDRNVTGTGVGGVFGLFYGITNNIILNIVQAQGDTRSRYRVTGGLQFYWSPDSDTKQKRVEPRTTRTYEQMLLASGSGTAGPCL